MNTTKLLAGIFTLGLWLQANAQYFPTNGLAAYYPFNGNANDESGNGKNGVVSGAVSAADRFGATGKAYHFNGQNSYVRVSPLVTTSQPFTWAVWFRPNYATLPAQAGVLMSQGSAPSEASPWLNILNDGRVSFYSYYYTSANTMYSTARSQWDTNAWYQVVITSDASGNRALYINGQVEGTANGIPFGYNPGYAYLSIGADARNLGYFSGDIDDVLIYSRNLSAAEVQNLYLAGLPFKITQSPQSQVTFFGKTATFTVTTTNGVPPLSYQWLKDNTPILDATNATLTLTNLQSTNTGSYTVVITDVTTKNVTSDPANLTVVTTSAIVDIALYAGVAIDGVVGATFGVQASTDLGNPNGWVGVTNITLGIAKQIWYDAEPASKSQRYYRVVPGPISIP